MKVESIAECSPNLRSSFESGRFIQGFTALAFNLQGGWGGGAFAPGILFVH